MAALPEARTNGSSQQQIDFVHTGPGTLAGRFLRTFWHPVVRAQDIAAGRAVPVRVMSEDLTVYRGESGQVHAVAFRCAHRGTQLSTGWVEGEDLRCFYHGWKYDGNGQCIEQPAEPEPFCSRIKIKSYPVQEYLGLVFAYLGEGEPPSLPRYSNYEGKGVRRVGGATVLPVNYFNRLENAPDHAHLAFVHSPFVDEAGIPRVESEETEWGVMTTSYFPGDNSVNRTHLITPNVSLFPSGTREPGAPVWTDFIAWGVPVDDQNYRFFQVMMTHGVTEVTRQWGDLKDLPGVVETGLNILDGDSRVSDHLKRPDIFELQDFVAQRGQGIVADRENEHLARTDLGVNILRRIWEREMRRLEAGQPLKEWRVPEGLASAHTHE